jgi:uncharacterized protein (TIGR03663 family)
MSDRRDRVVLAVAGLTLVALLARLLALSGRPFHWSEGRVGYWALRFFESGAFEYRPVAGGPLVYVLARWAFELGGVTDAVARTPVALIGGLLPAVALLFRGSLDDGETVAFAGLLAANPLLLYYSRFLSGHLPAAAFSLLALGGAIHYRRTGYTKSLYLGAGGLAAAFAGSWFTLASVLVWIVAGLFALDEARVRRSPDAAVETLRSGRPWLARHATPLARAFFVFLGVWYVFFAPRAPGLAPGLYDPTKVFAVAGAAFEGAIREFFEFRVVHRLNPRTPGRHGLVEYAVSIVRTLIETAPVTLTAGFLGFFSERYRENSRRLVAFGGYTVLWGVFVFAIAAPTTAPWVAVHLVPLAAIPAAVGVARVVGRLQSWTTPDDYGRVTLTVSLVVAVVAVGALPVAGAYDAPEHGSPFTQYAQPKDDPESILPQIETAIEGNDGIDVLYVAPRFYTRSEYDSPPIANADRNGWGNRLPLPWYFERADAEVGSAFNASYVGGDTPPVVVTVPSRAEAVGKRLDGDYTRVRLQMGLTYRNVTVFVEGVEFEQRRGG